MLYLVPDMFGPPGGIARYCRMIGMAATGLGRSVHVAALRDHPSVRPIPLTSYRACSGNRPLFVLHVIRSALRHRFEMVVAGHINLGPLAHWIARWQRIPLVTFLYGIDAWRPLSRSRASALRASNHLIAISHYTAQRSANFHGLDPRTIKVLYNCLDPDFVAMRLEPTFTTEAPLTLLTVGRMSISEQYKGHQETLRSLVDLIPQFPTLRYCIVGEGDDRPRLEHLASDLGVGNVVQFRGTISEAALRDTYQQATVFVMPSRAEGFGFVFLEAMAYGLPIVAGNQDATVEVVEDNVTGLLVAPDSTSEIVEALRTLLMDSHMRKQMGDAGKQRVARYFSYSQFKERLRDILENVQP